MEQKYNKKTKQKVLTIQKENGMRFVEKRNIKMCLLCAKETKQNKKELKRPTSDAFVVCDEKASLLSETLDHACLCSTLQNHENGRPCREVPEEQDYMCEQPTQRPGGTPLQSLRPGHFL